MKPALCEARMTVTPDWIDHNGHMNVAYFVVAFDAATDAAYQNWGLGLDYPTSSGCSVFTLGINVDYLGELFEGDPLHVTTQLVDFDAKRLHYYHRMYRGQETNRAQLMATNECLSMNVNLSSRKSQPFPEDALATLRGVYVEHRRKNRPEELGRTLGIRRS